MANPEDKKNRSTNFPSTGGAAGTPPSSPHRLQLNNHLRGFGRMFAAIGTSSVLVSSGLLAYQMYHSSQQQEEIKQLQDQLQDQQIRIQHRRLLAELSREETNTSAQYIPVPRDLLDKLNRFDELQLNPIETKEAFKAIIPRHLKKNWRLLHQANTGEYELHLKAVKELSKVKLHDGEFSQLAQSVNYRTAVGLASCANVDLRFFLDPPPLPPSLEGRTIVSLFKEVLTRLPRNSDQLHDCINYYTTTALDDYLTRGDAEALLDSDISHEFFRESHHIHSIPRPQVDEVSYSLLPQPCKYHIPRLYR
jgi:hypothetical protein